MDIKEEVKTLREQIEYHSNRYYNMDAPEIMDRAASAACTPSANVRAPDCMAATVWQATH